MSSAGGGCTRFSQTPKEQYHAFDDSQELRRLSPAQLPSAADRDLGPGPSPAHTRTTRALLMVDLGTLGGTESNAAAINARGQVTGYSHTADGKWRAFLYDKGVMTDLGDLGGARPAINARGQVVGYSRTGSTESMPSSGQRHDRPRCALRQLERRLRHQRRRGDRRRNTPSRPVGQWCHHQLGTLGDTYSTPKAINNAGEIIGSSFTRPKMSMLLWKDGTMTDLGTLGGDWSNGLALNDVGQVVGGSGAGPNNIGHAFLWHDGVMINLGTLGGWASMAFAINNAGHRRYKPHANDLEHAFLWQNGVMTDLGDLAAPGAPPLPSTIRARSSAQAAPPPATIMLSSGRMVS